MSMVERKGLRPFLKWVGGKRQLLPVLRQGVTGWGGRQQTRDWDEVDGWVIFSHKDGTLAGPNLNPEGALQ